MDYRPTHVMMRSEDLKPTSRNSHGATECNVELDVILPVLEFDFDRGRSRVRVPHKKFPDEGWWLSFNSLEEEVSRYGLVIDMSMPHLKD